MQISFPHFSGPATAAVHDDGCVMQDGIAANHSQTFKPVFFWDVDIKKYKVRCQGKAFFQIVEIRSANEFYWRGKGLEGLLKKVGFVFVIIV